MAKIGASDKRISRIVIGGFCLSACLLSTHLRSLKLTEDEISAWNKVKEYNRLVENEQMYENGFLAREEINQDLQNIWDWGQNEYVSFQAYSEWQTSDFSMKIFPYVGALYEYYDNVSSMNEMNIIGLNYVYIVVGENANGAPICSDAVCNTIEKNYNKVEVLQLKSGVQGWTYGVYCLKEYCRMTLKIEK